MNSLASPSVMLPCIILCTLATFLPRALPFFCFRKDLPVWLKNWLEYVPAAVMAALVAPDLLYYGGQGLNPDPLHNLFLLGAICTCVFSVIVKNFFATIAFAMVFVAGMRFFGLGI